tara:strand:- start:132 stop:374 length:243 start_codon:yes stop_codon:yes gene_type:complete
MQNYDVTKLRIGEAVPKQVLLDESAAADRLSLSQQVLRLWRQKRKQGLEAPVIPFVKLGRLVKYRQVDFDQFLMEQLYAN